MVKPYWISNQSAVATYAAAGRNVNVTNSFSVACPISIPNIVTITRLFYKFTYTDTAGGNAATDVSQKSTFNIRNVLQIVPGAIATRLVPFVGNSTWNVIDIPVQLLVGSSLSEFLFSISFNGGDAPVVPAIGDTVTCNFAFAFETQQQEQADNSKGGSPVLKPIKGKGGFRYDDQ